MNGIRKFYNAETAEVAGGVASTEAAPTEGMSLAAAMAKHGRKTDENSMAAKPIDISERRTEVKTDPTPAATAKVDEPEKAPVPEVPKTPEVESPKADTAPIVPEAPKVQTLEEVLKNQQPDTIFKALGFDDNKANFVKELQEADPKLVGIMQAYKSGTLGEYVRELSTDYQKMSAEEVMRHQLRREYPKASDKALEALYEAEIVEKYKLDPDKYDEPEVEKGKLLLEAKAERYRDEFTANQEKFLLPKAPEPKKEVQPDNTADIQRQQIEAYRRELSETPYTKDIIANKTITIGEGAEAFKYPVDPNSLIDVLTDGQKWVDVMYRKEGDQYIPNVEHQMMVAAFAQDSKKFLNEYAKHLKSIGAKEVIEPIENASKPEGTTPSKSEVPATSLAAAMAKSGRRVG